MADMVTAYLVSEDRTQGARIELPEHALPEAKKALKESWGSVEEVDRETWMESEARFHRDMGIPMAEEDRE